MVLSDLFLRIYFQRLIRCPHDERNLDLFFRRDEYGHAVHIQISFAERFSVVGYEYHAAALLGYLAKDFYYRMNEIIRIDDCVVVGIHQLIRIRFGHLHGSAYGAEHFELGRVFLVVCGAVARAGVEYNQHLVLVAGEYLFP